MSKMHNIKSLRKQAGLTLIEMGVSLAIFALVIAGALSLYQMNANAQKANQLISDITGLRGAVKGWYAQAGNYGTGSLNSILISAKKIPSTMIVSGSTINHVANGTVVVSGASANFTIALSNIATDICTDLVTSATGYNAVKVGSSAARTTFPITPPQAAADCSAAPNQTVTLTSS